VGAFDIRFDGHAVLSCEMGTEEMAHRIHSAAKNQELDIWSHSVKVVRAATTAAHSYPMQCTPGSPRGRRSGFGLWFFCWAKIAETVQLLRYIGERHHGRNSPAAVFDSVVLPWL
jgi:hypothetical protein